MLLQPLKLPTILAPKKSPVKQVKNRELTGKEQQTPQQNSTSRREKAGVIHKYVLTVLDITVCLC